MRSFSYKREVLSLDGWSSLDRWSGLGYQVHSRGIQVYRHEGNFGTLGGEVLSDFCFLEPRRVGRSPRSTELDIPFLFPA